MKTVKHLLASALLLCLSISVVAQSPMTPYSRYGYGILRDNATSTQRAMGGVGYAMNSGRQINVMNPASYAAIDSLTFLFDMGISGTKLWSSEMGTDRRMYGRQTGGGLDYLTMQFPVSKRIGVSLGLLPFSSVGYNFGSKIDNGSTVRTGSGGMNQFYAGVGGKLFEGFTLGANIGYLFGTTTNDTYVYTNNGSTTLFETVIEVRDYQLQFGAQYGFNVGRKNRVTFGLTYSPGKSLSGHAWGLNYDITSSTSPQQQGYTSLHDKYTIPAFWGAGINYHWDERLMVEFDLTYQPWKNARYTLIDTNTLSQNFNNRIKTALGVQYVPRPRGNWVQRINLRAGGFYEKSYLSVKGYPLREYGASFGLGLPAPGSKTLLNLGVEWRCRKASRNALIKEDYLSFTLGINFNERWFYKNKFR